MGIMANEGGGGEFEQVPQGTHNAVCYKIVDAGTSLNEYQGEVKKQHSIFIFWELPESQTADGRPMSIFNKYTLSLNERAKLRQHLQSWRNKAFTQEELANFDVTSVLGVNCKLDVGLTSGGKAKVTGLFGADGGSKKTATVNEQVVFDLEDYCKEFSGQSCEASKKMCDVFDELPRFIQYQIGGCDEQGRDKVEPCFEMQAAMKVEAGPTPPSKKDDDGPEDADFEDDIPF